MTEAEAMAVLVSAVPGYGRRERLLRAAGSAAALLADPYAYAEISEDGAAALREAVRRSDDFLDSLRMHGTQLILKDAEGWPSRLSEIRCPPHLLFCQGLADLTDAVMVAGVGTRDASPYGLRMARRIVRDLAQQGVCVVSGLALGIDAACHQGALDAGGRTVAVLGGALDRFYPRENRPLMERIVAEGGSVVTEYAPGVAPTRYSFLSRNRIIAGMSLGVFVAEGRQRSGALSTAVSALEEGREVFALPGNVDEPRAALPNRLITEGAKLVTCAQDILAELVIEPGSEKPEKKRRKPARPKPIIKEEKAPEASVPASLGAEEQAVCRAVLPDGADYDEVCEKTGIPSETLGSLLIEMEMDGFVEMLPGNRIGPGPTLYR